MRQSVARVERRGWRAEVVPDEEITPELDEELAEVEGDWRARQRRLIGFAMTLGRPAGPADRGGGIYVLAHDPDGRLRSFLRFAPYRDGLSLDLMRRAAEEPNGLTEALVVAAIEHAKKRGLASVSLNFAGFAHVMAADAALNRSQRALRFLLRRFHGRFQLERLVRFNAKFFPTWQPRYLVYDGLGHLPLSALRVLQAEAYLPAPAPPGPQRGVFRGYAWVRFGSAAAAVCAGLTASTLVLAGNSASAHARALRVSAHPGKEGWSFVYRGSHGSDPRALPLPAQGPPRDPSSRTAGGPGRRRLPGRRGGGRRRTGHPDGSASPRRAHGSLRSASDPRGRARSQAVPGPAPLGGRGAPGPGKSRGMRWRLIVVLAAVFLGVGSYGAWAYVHNYQLYRGFPAPSDPAGVASGTLLERHFQSTALGRQDSYLVYEPPGYQQLAASGTRFPVLYLLHGSNSNGETYIDVGRAGVALDELMAAQRTRPFLIVIPLSTDGSLTDDTEWANAGDGRFESETLEVVRQVDEHWPTLADRSGRVLAGLSMGGYGASTSGCTICGSSAPSRAGPATSPRRGPGRSRPPHPRCCGSTARPPTRAPSRSRSAGSRCTSSSTRDATIRSLPDRELSRRSCAAWVPSFALRSRRACTTGRSGAARCRTPCSTPVSSSGPVDESPATACPGRPGALPRGLDRRRERVLVGRWQLARSCADGGTNRRGGAADRLAAGHGRHAAGGRNG